MCLQAVIREVCGVLYVRLSCHIYNEISDYERLSDAMLEICELRDSLVDYTGRFSKLLNAE